MINRPGIFNLQTRTTSFQDKEKLLEKVYSGMTYKH